MFYLLLEPLELLTMLKLDFIFLFLLGSDDESPRREVRNGVEESGLEGSTEKSEGSGSDDEEVGTSDSDKEHDSRTNVESTGKASTRYSTIA